MGLLDKLKNIRFSFHKKMSEATEKPAPKIQLSSDPEMWVDELLNHTDLVRQFNTFSKEAEELKKHAEDVVKKFTDEGILSAIPERARTVNALHGDQYAVQVKKLLKKVHFEDIFSFEDSQAEFLAAATTFKDQTKKNVSALGEFMYDELKETQATLQELEDHTINFIQTLEEAQFPEIMKIHDAQEEIEMFEATQKKHKELLGKLKTELQTTQEKRQKIEDKINEQRTLIRNQDALEALEKLSKIEHDLDDTTSKYAKACTDAGRYFKRYAESAPGKNGAQVIIELPKDSARYLKENPELIRDALEELATQLEDEGQQKLGNLVKRLREQSHVAMRDAARINEILPEQKTLRQAVMKDIAAVNIYDQQQFLIRARREEKEIQTKLSYVENQLDKGRKITLERQMKDAAINLGAEVGDLPEGPEEESEDIEEDLEEAEEELAQEEQDLEHAEETGTDRAEKESEETLEEAAKITSADELIKQAAEEAEELGPEVEGHKPQKEEKESDVFIGEPEEEPKSEDAVEEATEEAPEEKEPEAEEEVEENLEEELEEDVKEAEPAEDTEEEQDLEEEDLTASSEDEPEKSEETEWNKEPEAEEELEKTEEVPEEPDVQEEQSSEEEPKVEDAVEEPTPEPEELQNEPEAASEEPVEEVPESKETQEVSEEPEEPVQETEASEEPTAEEPEESKTEAEKTEEESEDRKNDEPVR